MLMNGVPTQSLTDLKGLKERLEEQVGKMVAYRKKILESRMRIVGLAQYKARLEQIQQLYRQLSTAVEILDKKQQSQTMLEQSYFLKEFEKLAKKLKVKYLQDYAQKQQAMDLHNTILISETRF